MRMHQLYQLALKSRKTKREVEEGTKTGTWRAGGSGFMLPGSEKYIGACQRKSILRHDGIEAEEHDAQTQLMFEAGLSNEDIWYATLVESGIPPERIKREEEIATKWETSAGTSVTGRPDLVILDESGKPEHIYELKLISSLWTAKSTLLEMKPKDAHLAQAAHYFWQLDAKRASLLYTSRSNYAIGKTYHSMFSKSIVEGVNDQYFENGSEGFLKNSRPFFVEYELDWHTDGHLLYKQVTMDGSEADWVRTELTREGIKRYYETLSSSVALNKLPARPSQLTATGMRASYRDCQYCPLAPVCDKAEGKGLEVWKSEVLKWNTHVDKIKELEAKHKIGRTK